MKNITVMILMIISSIINAQTICEGRQIQPMMTFNQCDYNQWVLVFEDDFDGNTIDLSKWELQEWSQGAFYGENGRTQEYNTLDNLVVSNGTLKIIARSETVQRRAVSWMPDNQMLSDN